MKNCLSLFLMLISFSAWAHAGLNPYVVDHDRFYDMPREQQEMIVKKRMEMMVELEASWPIQTYASRYDMEKMKKLVETMRFLQNFMFKDAYAVDYGKDFSRLSSGFSEALRRVQNSCIYGGYVSTMVKGYCLHPARVAGHPEVPKESQNLIAKNYDNPGNRCKAPTEISCNPMVFGYKKVAKSDKEVSSPFCVPTGFVNPKQNAAHNVSHACMKKSLGAAKDDNTDSPEDRKNFLIEQMKSNKDSFEAVQRPLFKMCACNEKQTNQNLRYYNYMRPHRTCYGMLKSLRNASYSECAVLKVENVNNDYKDFVKKFNNFFDEDKELEVPIKALRSGFDEDYQKIIDDPMMKNFCKNPDIIVPPTAEPKKTLVCKSKCEEKEVTTEKGDKSKSFSCNVEKLHFDVTDEKGAKTEEIIDLKKAKGLPLTPDLSKEPYVFEVEIEGVAEKAKCDFVPPKKAEEAAPSCSITATEDKEKGIYTLTVDPPAPKENGPKPVPGKEPKLSEIKWAGAEGMKENTDKNPNVRLVTQTDKEQVISVTAKFKDKQSKCETKVPGNGLEAKNYKIVLKADDAKNTDPKAELYHLVASIMLNDKEVEKLPAGFKISYENSSRVAPKKDEDKKDEDEKDQAQDGDGSIKQGPEKEPENTEIKVSDKADPGAEKKFVTTSLSVTEKKQVGKTSLTTAVLLDEKGAEAATSNGVEIQAQEELKKEVKPQWQPSPSMGGNPGRQMQAPIKRNHGLQMIR